MGQASDYLGAAGLGGNCEACDKTLAPTQLVMTVPAGEEKVIHRHADCFNALEYRATSVFGHADRLTAITNLCPYRH